MFANARTMGNDASIHQHKLSSNANSCRQSRIVELSSIVASNTLKLDQYFASAGVPTPSFDIDAPVNIPLPPDLESLRESILDASTELNELLLGPRETMVDWQFNYYVPLHAISHYKLAHTFPVGEEASFEDIAEKSGLSTPLVRRLLRHAIANRIFKEVRKGVVAHTAMSRLLAEDTLFQDYVATGEDTLRATSYTVRAMLKYPGSEEPGQTGFSLGEGSDDSFYQIMASDPRRAERFMNCMIMKLQGPGYDVEHLAGYSLWETLPAGSTVVDVGGSHGEVASAIAKRYPSLKFIVQDLEATVDVHTHLSDPLEGRIRFMAHNFFQPQPVKGADAYILRWILHNWPDKYCLKILRNLIPALKTGARILINESCLPEPNTMPNRADRKLRVNDTLMLTLFNSQERDEEEWIDLFRRTDQRFRFVGMSTPEGANLSTLEFEWAPV
ncbi:putative O-methyltransferase [Viridothelium virens]|uniref:Putative O-methyltransferase n=1 Tax=Viridothelium virens TaxID=1048519 RepID=A0A6A6HED4_VIRVR|nr:putative O-methyltransferase [Viridothelium virens]